MTGFRIFLATLLLLPQLAAAVEGGSVSDAPAVAERPLVRQISLAELGYRNGISFRRLSGNSTVYVPVPNSASVRAATLHLDLEQGETADTDRYLQISLAGRVVATRALDGVEGQLSVPVSLRPSDIFRGPACHRTGLFRRVVEPRLRGRKRVGRFP